MSYLLQKIIFFFFFSLLFQQRISRLLLSDTMNISSTKQNISGWDLDNFSVWEEFPQHGDGGGVLRHAEAGHNHAAGGQVEVHIAPRQPLPCASFHSSALVFNAFDLLGRGVEWPWNWNFVNLKTPSFSICGILQYI
mmetsp:Transcript_47965/g.79717  ORF Transcript_47965/g.79717 Transcript_47965/m.79717 type:complete len:137 (-) Transcript_47965:466-876(-)